MLVHRRGVNEVKQTSLDDSALLVKSLQQELKHFSTKLEYIRRKSCIWAQNELLVGLGKRGAYLFFLNDFGHLSLFSGILLE